MFVSHIVIGIIISFIGLYEVLMINSEYEASNKPKAKFSLKKIIFPLVLFGIIVIASVCGIYNGHCQDVFLIIIIALSVLCFLLMIMNSSSYGSDKAPLLIAILVMISMFLYKQLNPDYIDFFSFNKIEQAIEEQKDFKKP